jgi:hypothetical protein
MIELNDIQQRLGEPTEFKWDHRKEKKNEPAVKGIPLALLGAVGYRNTPPKTSPGEFLRRRAMTIGGVFLTTPPLWF